MARPGLGLNRKFRRLTRALKSEALARGSLELLWDVAYENGDEYLGTSADVESAARWDGEPSALVKALLESGGDGNAGFIEEIPDRPEHYQVHDLFQNAPEYVQKRMLRELRRNQRGVTISDLRREAGRKGRAVLPGQGSSKRRANGGQLPAHGGQLVANGDTPAPALKNNTSELKNSSDPSTFAKGSSKPSHEAEKLAQLLKAEILRNKPDYRITQSQLRQWATTADRMIRLDRRQPERIDKVIRWAQRDEFWRSNVLSMDKLREQVDRLEMQMETRRSNGKSPPTQVEPFDLVAYSRAQLGEK